MTRLPIQWDRVTGVNEAADLFGVQPGTVRHWRSNLNILPSPDALVSGRPLWDVWRLVDWGVATGRLTLEPVE